MAPNPDRELADARAAIDRGDERAALKRLENARRGYARRHDAAGLEHLLALADVLQAADERERNGRDNLRYAIRQNLRLESRRRAQQHGEPWQDPYPGLRAPTEHTRIVITRGIKLWIALGVILATLVIVGASVAVALFSTNTTDVTVRLVNDTGSRVTVRGCDDSDCTTFWAHADLDPGLSTERDVPVNDVVEYFEVERSGRTECLPLRVHDAYERSGEQASLLVARLSAATPCPGITVLPRVARETGL
ncbi:MAG: hypothetical protein ACXVZ3_14935 [Gaiellaceae bacterium]